MKQILILLLTILMAFQSSFVSASPTGWGITGSAPNAYELTTDSQNGMPSPSGYFESIKSVEEGKFGASMQTFYPKEYLGKRVKVTGMVKTTDLTDQAALWVRVDAEKKPGVSFDNMNDRPIKGNTDWSSYSIVVDVPDDASLFSYGAIIIGEGKLWMDEFKFEVVDQTVALTGEQGTRREAPLNTDFSQ